MRISFRERLRPTGCSSASMRVMKLAADLPPERAVVVADAKTKDGKGKLAKAAASRVADPILKTNDVQTALVVNESAMSSKPSRTASTRS
jgi:hypothetical protein